MNELYRERLAAILKDVGGEYDEVVKELGRERQMEFGADFSLGDFIAGAAAIYKLALKENERLPWPATSWVWAVLGGKNPLWPDGRVPELKEPFRRQWLVVAVPPNATYLGRDAEVLASFGDGEEAERVAERCNKMAQYRSGDYYEYLRVRVAGHGYDNRREFADVWAKIESDEEE